MSRSTGSDEPSIRSLALAVYVPIVIFAIGEGAVIPFIVLGAQDLGASASVAGAIFALTGAASFAFAIPAGSLISRFGGRRAAMVAVGFVLVGLVGVVLGSSVAGYALSIFVLGIGWAIWRLVRFDFLVGAVGVEKRGRALAVMGGSQRIGRFVGPLLAAASTTVAGINGAFFLHIGVAVLALAVFVSVPLTDVERRPRRERLKLRALVSEHRSSFGRAGVGLVALIVLRSARPVALPLWAVHIGTGPRSSRTDLWRVVCYRRSLVLSRRSRDGSPWKKVGVHPFDCPLGSVFFGDAVGRQFRLTADCRVTDGTREWAGIRIWHHTRLRSGTG